MEEGSLVFGDRERLSERGDAFEGGTLEPGRGCVPEKSGRSHGCRPMPSVRSFWRETAGGC